MAITITQLSAFLAVVRGGSVTAAAETLVVTQPSVSAAVSALGRELGCPLFVRVGRGIQPTAAGEAFAPYAAEVLGLLEQGRRRAREAARPSCRLLRIAAVTSAAESFVPSLLHEFAACHPEIQVTLDVGNRTTVLSRLADHEADLAIAGRPSADSRFVGESLYENEVICIAPPGYPLDAERAVSAASLADRVWLLREPGSGTRALCERFLADRCLQPATLTLASNGAIQQAVRSGLGVSLVSRVVVEDAIAAGLVRHARLLDGPAVQSWFLLRPSVGAQPCVVDAFVEFVRGHMPHRFDRSDPVDGPTCRRLDSTFD